MIGTAGILSLDGYLAVLCAEQPVGVSNPCYQLEKLATFH